MRIGAGPGHIAPTLIAAIMRKEQFFYKNMSTTMFRLHENLDILHIDRYSIGAAQMEIGKIPAY
jgi:hypothetical protein